MKKYLNLDMDFEKEKEFWISSLTKDIEKSSFSDFNSENIKSEGEKMEIDFCFPQNISKKIVESCNGSELGIFILLLTGVNYILSRYTSNKKIIIGTPKIELNNRNNQTSDLLLIKTEVEEEESFKQTLLKVKDMVINVSKMGKLRIEEIQKLLEVENFEENTALFDTIVLLNNIHKKDCIKDIDVSTIFTFNIVNDQIRCKIQYNNQRVSEERVIQIRDCLVNFFNVVISNPNIKLGQIDILSQDEKNSILSNGLGKKIRYEKNQVLHKLFEQQVEKTPDRIAVKFLDKKLTYKQLNSKANKVAKQLRERGVIQGKIVGLLVERSVDMIIGILAILKSGGAYLPINPKNPVARIEYLLNDSRANILITHNDLANGINFDRQLLSVECNDEELDEPNLENWNKPIDLAYVIYTSGTTGNPKGVMIKHENVTNLIAGLYENVYKLYGEYLNIACLAPYYFDASVQQIFASLLQGHKLIITPEDVRVDGDLLVEFYKENSINISDGTPIHINMITNSVKINKVGVNVKHFIIGGEQLQYNLVSDFFGKVKSKNICITNVYGPTECCVDCTSFLINKENMNKLNNIPIGNAMPNQIIYVLDEKLRMVPRGVQGEIYISGAGIGAGYLNNDELSTERFIEDPFNSGLVMYKTGDVGKWGKDGHLEYKGRIDFQVKIRGYRIELGEIENAILSYKKTADQNVNNKEIKTCKKCSMNSLYTSITFNNDDVCCYCENFDRHKNKINKYFKEINDFRQMMKTANNKRRGEYDCLLLYSGGKDSSYVLYRLVEMGYKVLAFTFDNGYISQGAFDNISKITKSLNVDSVIYSAEKMKEIFVESLKNDSTVCSGCFKALTTISTKVALDKGINVIITGLSRGQIMDTKLQGLYEEGIFDVEEIEEKLSNFRRFYHSVNDRTQQLLNIELKDNDAFNSLHFIDFYRYEESSAEEILEYLKQKDLYWRTPKDTGFCSTNCLINDVGIYMHLKDKGYHNYMIPLSWSYRLGQITKVNAEKELETTFDMERINRILDEIGYSKEYNEIRIIKEVAVVDNIDSYGSNYLSVYFVSDEKINIPSLRKYLSNVLPEYEIPSYYVQVKEIPKTANGKVNKKVLPNIKASTIIETKYEPPRNKMERELVDIWEDVLRINKIGIHDNFLDLGGNSLSAMILVSKIIKKFNVNITLSDIIKLLTIEKIAQLINNKEDNISFAIPKVSKKEYYPVSSNQKRMFILDSLYPNRTGYNIPTIQLIKGEIDFNKFNGAFKKLISRHESLRTSFKLIKNEVVQQVHESIDFNIEYIEAKREDVNKLIAEFIKPFDLAEAPLIRVGLIKIDENEHLFLLDIHHIISDAITLNILINDFTKLYDGNDLPELELQYKDYSSWQNSFLKSEALKRQERFWCENLKDYNYQEYLPVDKVNFSKNALSKTVKFNISKELTRKLEQLAQETDTTLFMILLAAYNILLYRYSNRNDIAIGTPIAGRHYPGLEKIAGIFINTLVLRNQLNGRKRIREFLNEVKENSLRAFDNQDYPFEELVEKLDVKREMHKNPIFDTMFVLQSVDYKTIKIEGLDFSTYEFNLRTSIIDIILEVEKDKEKFNMNFQYNEMLFKKETIEMLSYNYIKILRHMVKDNVEINEILLSNFK